MHTKSKRTTISVSNENYQALNEIGKTADSFNDVITILLRNFRED
jgi:predicted CopG family antitoxin